MNPTVKVPASICEEGSKVEVAISKAVAKIVKEAILAERDRCIGIVDRFRHDPEIVKWIKSGDYPPG